MYCSLSHGAWQPRARSLVQLIALALNDYANASYNHRHAWFNGNRNEPPDTIQAMQPAANYGIPSLCIGHDFWMWVFSILPLTEKHSFLSTHRLLHPNPCYQPALCNTNALLGLSFLFQPNTHIQITDGWDIDLPVAFLNPGGIRVADQTTILPEYLFSKTYHS